MVYLNRKENISRHLKRVVKTRDRHSESELHPEKNKIRKNYVYGTLYLGLKTDENSLRSKFRLLDELF